jgi:hypothetical protein
MARSDVFGRALEPVEKVVTGTLGRSLPGFA